MHMLCNAHVHKNHQMKNSQFLQQNCQNKVLYWVYGISVSLSLPYLNPSVNEQLPVLISVLNVTVLTAFDDEWVLVLDVLVEFDTNSLALFLNMKGQHILSTEMEEERELREIRTKRWKSDKDMKQWITLKCIYCVCMCYNSNHAYFTNSNSTIKVHLLLF